ncbi:EAL domain-containing protein [Acidiferrimicrobium sp. IK]|uniref:putative bifunctional diguanylate cyclase/phosphodiesterase n=1 Tax=Acidiferrimicrobium sp. IK TaxID=2871700 RepID=UPI0021CB27CF|nr:EAL domain-containing protein [Acidiferrimicrobium sp. IK]MCU4182764.1 EAL domain-containing protein [Acidiferrimicrobium sp. IK]
MARKTKATTPAAWKVALGVGLVAVASYFVLPGTDAKNVGYSMIGVASVCCVAAGMRMHRPAPRSGWYPIATGNLLFVVGDGVLSLYPSLFHHAAPFPSVADAFYLAGYPFLIYGILRLTQRGRDDRNGVREGLADAGIVSIAALALFWHLLMGSYAQDPSIDAFGRAVELAYPVMDLGVLFILAQGLFSGAARRSVHSLLAAAMVSMIVADFTYDVLVLHNTYSTGNPIDAGWLLNYVLVGVAALHPDMALAPGGASGERDGGRRLPVIALAGFVAPVILLVSGVRSSQSDVAVMAVLAMALFALVVQRMRWMLGRITRQTASLRRSLSDRDDLEAELRHQALHDGLTGLANRTLLQDRVEHALAGAVRTRSTVAVCFCDLDGFKTVNDSLGHLAGDQLLVAAGKRLASVVRPGDTAARLGGDEFAVLMEGITDPSAATAVAERIVSVLRQPVDLNGRQISLSVSVGVAVADVGSTAEQLLSEADSAMYEAKASGRNRFTVFEEAMHSRILERLELTNAFAGALQRGEFYLDYQPQFSLQDRKLEGFEALLRWRHPALGLVAPDRFIHLAEETGHIVPIGRWVIEQACRQGAAWSADGSTLTMSVNLSGRQLTDANLVDDLRTALSMSGLPPSQLVLEITESVLMVDGEESLRVLADLKATGVRLAIDDFGTGYSSLNYLRQFPFDLLKIDKSFVDPLVDPGGEGTAFIATIVSLAHSLGLATVAEGLEYADQQERLISLGCDSAQGFLLARPLDVAAAGRLASDYLATL